LSGTGEAGPGKAAAASMHLHARQPPLWAGLPELGWRCRVLGGLASNAEPTHPTIAATLGPSGERTCSRNPRRGEGIFTARFTGLAARGGVSLDRRDG